MDCDKLRIVFAGTPEFAVVALSRLLDSSHQIVGVLTQPDRRAGRGRQLMASPVKQLALQHAIAVQQPPTLRTAEALADLTLLQPDLLVVAAYGLILPPPVLQLPPLGCVNIHASLLPRWRGAAPIHRAILAGDNETGVSIMQMDAGLDTGAVLRQVKEAITMNMTSGELHDRLAAVGATALLDTLKPRCDGSLQASPQSESGITYAEKLSKSEARLDFSRPAADLHRQIQAFNPWPVAETTLDGERIRLWRSQLPKLTDGARFAVPGGQKMGHQKTALPGHIFGLHDGCLQVATGDGLLQLTELQRPGKRALPAADFARSRDLTNSLFA